MTHEPRIVGFLCNWCSYRGADLAGMSRLSYAPNLRVIRVMCSGRVDPTFVLKAFASGADGVIVSGCHPGDCHYLEGNYKALRRMSLLQPYLEGFGIDRRRLRLAWISASEGDRFAALVDDMTRTLREMGSVDLEQWRRTLRRAAAPEAAPAVAEEQELQCRS